MNKTDPNIGNEFNCQSATIQVAETAKNYLAKGHLHIWIYLIENRFQFHYVELMVISDFFVGHYRCQTIVKGMSGKAWEQLKVRMASIIRKGEPQCNRQKP